ncbi:MAG: hypothetical protein WDO73_36730 [Ignavibacteriota bacterium]
MTRRDFIFTATAATAFRAGTAAAPLTVPVHRLMDKRAHCTPQQLQRFSSILWPEAVREFQQGRIQLQVTEAIGEIRRLPSGRPLFIGLLRGVLNVVITDHVPMDYGSVAGVTTMWEGYHLCVIALSDAHGNQVPYFSVNTCVHELLHALLQDIFVNRAKWYQSAEREFRTDWYATQLWLFHDGSAIRKSAAAYLARLRTAPVF